MFRNLVSVLVLVVILSSSAFAGVVHLSNGDRLSGKIVKMADGKLVIESELAGTIEIPVENIKTLESVDVLEMHFNNGTILKQPVGISSSSGRIKTVAGAYVDSQEIAIADLELINPPIPEAPRWKGDLSAGATYTSGNTNNESLALSASLSKETEQDRTTFGADLYSKDVEVQGSSDKITTEDWWKLRGKYDYFYSEKTYVFGEGRYEQDKIALLDRRVIVGGGLGYKWLKSEPENFSLEIGLTNIYEDYDDGTKGESKFSALTGYHYDLKFNKVFSFVHETSYYPSAEDFSDYYLTTSAELRTKISSNLFTNAKVLYDYDSTPAVDRKNTDLKLIFGVGVNF
jgi:putative salt-induced outer membrane protein YdiY